MKIKFKLITGIAHPPLYRNFLVPALLMLLSACQSVTVGQSVSSGQSSVSAQTTFGSYAGINITAFRLNRAIEIAPGSAGVYIQKGKIRPETDINPVASYKPYCRFEVNRLSDSVQKIEIGRFEVTRIVQEEEYVQRQVHLASSRGVRLGSGSLHAVVLSTSFYLTSTAQPDVRRLVCEHWDDPLSGEHLSVEQIRIALGEIMTVVLSGE